MSTPDTPATSSLILYQTEDGQTRLQCRLEGETLWLTQIQMAELFQTSVPNINLHLKAIYGERELVAEATIKSCLIVRAEGSRQVSRPVLHYNLGDLPGHPLAEIDAELKGVTDRILTMIGGLTK